MQSVSNVIYMQPAFPQDLAIASLLSGNLAAARAALTSALVQRMDAMGISLRPREISVLYLMAGLKRECPLGAIAALLSLSSTSTRQLVRGLAAGGWVRAVPGEEDRRFRSWRVTDEARRLLEELAAGGPDAALDSALHVLSAHERETLRDQGCVLLRALADVSLMPGSEQLDARFGAALTGGSQGFGALVDIWFGFTRLYRSMRAEQTRFLAGATNHVLDSAAYMALYRSNEQHCSLSDIATFLRVDQNTAARVTDRLESAGLIERRRNAANRRQMVVAPTAKGQILLSKVPPLDPAGSYYTAIGELPQRGADLAEALHKLTSGYLHGPVVDSGKLYTLFRQVQRQVTADLAPKLDAKEFRRAMSNFVTGVAVVTVAGQDGPRGVTVNSLTSVSLDPPILLICFDRRSSTLKRVQEVGSFGVNILTSEQKLLAQRFAKPGDQPAADPLDASHWLDDGGVPVLAGSLVRITCDMENTFEAGSHTIVFGRPRSVAVLEAESSPSALGYWLSGYLEVH